jgi:transposase
MTAFQFAPRDAMSLRRVPLQLGTVTRAVHPDESTRRWSRVGRPRHVTDAAIAEILDWHRHHETCVQLARRLGVSTSTVRNVVRSAGQHYKTPSPERRAEVLGAGGHRRRRSRS